MLLVQVLAACRHNAIESEAVTKPESEAQNAGGIATKLEGQAKEAVADGGDAEAADAAAKFKPGIKFKLAS